MSFPTYQRKLGRLFGGIDDGAGGTNETQPVPKHPVGSRIGFLDITEIQTPTLTGVDEQVLLTKEYTQQLHKKSEQSIRKYDSYALLMRRVVQNDGKRHIRLRSELCLQSSSLCSIVREIVTSTYDSLSITATPIVFPEPFYELFFKRDEIDHYEGEGQKEVKLLHEFMQKQKPLQDSIEQYDKLLPAGKISYMNLWILFPPNELLYVKGKYFEECWLCRDIHIEPRKLSWVVHGIRLDYDGQRIGMARQSSEISFKRSNGGIMDLSHLPIAPFHLLSEQEKDRVSARFVSRGKLLRNILKDNLLGFACKEYEGPTWRNFRKEGPEEDEEVPPHKQINERVVVDYKSFLEQDPGQTSDLVEIKKKPTQSKAADEEMATDFVDMDHGIDDIAISSIEDPTDPSKGAFEALLESVRSEYKIAELDDLLLLSPPCVPAYGLKSKEWGWVLIEKLEQTNFNTRAFELLQLEEATKKLVQALVSGAQSPQTDHFDDIIRGKGKGLVMLLHGNPGVGKTLMAESIAELRESPLYSVSGGELSTRVTRVETRLNDIFKLAKRWNAIVLVDEADVVLTKRSAVEIERNSLVAVWLRMIEYFEGVCFLTTNRRDELDEAFKSRINLTINMPELNPTHRARVWENLITTYNKRVEGDFIWTNEMFHALGGLQINGRVIKNILRTAEYFARSTNSKMTASHVNDVIKVELSETTDAKNVCSEMDELLKVPV
ncbi:hypothetical protein F4808DRAFT_425284 [Astrocystis sublimbata]|nr:hypothetical protein F4808DRAFT_425284 [Astrocystis sublimbata]